MSIARLTKVFCHIIQNRLFFQKNDQFSFSLLKKTKSNATIYYVKQLN